MSAGRIVVSIVILLGLSHWALADGGFSKISVCGHDGYLVTEGYLLKEGSDVRGLINANDLAGERHVSGLWTPTVDQCDEAETAVIMFLGTGSKDIKSAFPQIDDWRKGNPQVYQQAEKELALVQRDYPQYVRQFVGITVGQHKRIYCNFFSAYHLQPPFSFDPTKDFFEGNDGGHNLWQIEYDLRTKRCVNLSINGPWDYDK